MPGADLGDAFRGALLGTLAGDALGAPFEGWSAARIAREVGEIRAMLPGRGRAGTYTDDTQMMIVVAEWLIEDGNDEGGKLAERLAASYDPARGYGRGTTDVVRRLKAGESWETAAEHTFPRGSFGNGAAARVAPCALLLHHDREALERLVEVSAVVSHPHPLGLAGAALQARQIALAISFREQPIDPIAFVVELRSSLGSTEFRGKLRAVEECLENPVSAGVVRDRLGCNDTALGSVATALYCFLSRLESFEAAVSFAVGLGGDTDSIAAMTGAIAGAYQGGAAIPKAWRAGLE
ncbi:MAG: ADP-ribosylglycohydrolase family protein, partial [Candidatus Binatia bacterium]